MPKLSPAVAQVLSAPDDSVERARRRSRVERVASAQARVEMATRELVAALDDVTSLGLKDHPILEELRDAITNGRKILERARYISRHLPY